jgi:hypothetical protein
MSTSRRTLRWIFLAFFVCPAGAARASAQEFEAQIRVDSARPIATVIGKFSKEIRNLSFVKSIAGHANLAKRVQGLELFDSSGARVAYRKMIDGEYLAETHVRSWRYDIDLSPLQDVDAAAHVSWISGGKGILMLADLLPEGSRLGRVTINSDWNIFATMRLETGNVYTVPDADVAVFAIGNSWQLSDMYAGKFDPDVLLSGNWHFTSVDAAWMAGGIINDLRGVFGENPNVSPRRVLISNFPQTVSPGRWAAETRGGTVIIISSDMPFRTQSLQRLHEQLRHELFHFWIPNGVNLTGNYDWFYEGFALYHSLKLAVGVNRIRFEDFLDTLSRAHTIDSAPSQRKSLIEASAIRFSGSNTQVYARGMLVAFLCDLAMLRESNGKRSVETLLGQLYGKHRKPTDPVDANTAVLTLMRATPSLVPIVDRYIVGSDQIDWAPELESAGIEDSDPGILTTLRVKPRLNGKQKTLLDKLGYNNWRKLSRTSK